MFMWPSSVLLAVSRWPPLIDILLEKGCPPLFQLFYLEQAYIPIEKIITTSKQSASTSWQCNTSGNRHQPATYGDLSLKRDIWILSCYFTYLTTLWWLKEGLSIFFDSSTVLCHRVQQIRVGAIIATSVLFHKWYFPYPYCIKTSTVGVRKISFVK